ncbi:MAG: hypothetical protein LKE36_02175 [Bacilli bacterium]|jgi:hypothetical protein|nr:hypothetical protein [Bacilli bacterium]OQA78626.1 MAG: hypothetical protein BWY30_00558 [Tenericutes bacterium ADurb.Bin239]
MEIKEESGRHILYAEEGKVLQSVTDGLIIGPWLILGKNDSEIHYHDIDEPIDDALPKANTPKFQPKEESAPIEE